MAYLTELTRRTHQGIGATVLVEGPPGIGKTRLIEAFCDAAAADGMAVASTRATALDNLLPLGTLLHALEHGSPPLVKSSVLRSLGHSGSSPFWLIEELGEALEASLGDRRVAIAIDDAHWCDEVTALALRILAPRLASSPIVWVLGIRTMNDPHDVSQALGSLTHSGAETIAVGPLGRGAMLELVRSLLPAGPESLHADLVDRCEGNPFLLEELAHSLSIDRPGRPDHTPPLHQGLPAEFVQSISERLGGIGSEGEHVLRAASVLARPFDVEEVSLMLGTDLERTGAAVDAAVAAGALVREREGFSFSHDLIREAFYDGCDLVDRQVLHDAAAETIRTLGRSAAEAATHLAKGSHRRRGDAASVLDNVVEVLAYQAPGAAADLIVRTAGMLDGPERSAYLTRAIGLLATAGQVDAAIELGEEMLDGRLDPPSEAEVVLGLAQALKHAGRDRDVLAHTERVLQREGLTREARAELLAVQAHALLYTNQIERAEQVAVDAREEGGPELTPAAFAFASGALSVALRAKGELDEALEVARRAVEVADDQGGDAQQRHPRLWLARSLVALDRLVEAETVLEIGQREVDRFGSAWCLPLWQFYRSELRYAAGRLDDAVAEAEAGVLVAEHLTASALVAPLSATLCLLESLRGRFEDAEKHLARARTVVAAGAGTMTEDLAWPEGHYYSLAGEADRAFEALRPIYDELPGRLLMLAYEPPAAATLVRVAQEVDHQDHADRVVTAARSLARKNPDVAVICGAASHAEGLRRGDVARLEAAVELLATGSRPLARAAAEADLGAALIPRGETRRALSLLLSAGEIYEQTGCGTLADATRTRVEQVSPARSRPREGRAFGWDGLTNAELRVARLVASGKTNREVASELFLSPHTIDSHLRHVFNKLSISSRVELTRLVIEHDGV